MFHLPQQYVKPIAARTNHCIPKFMQPSPGCLIPPEPHGMLQILCACSGLLGHHPPNNMEPEAKRFSCSLKGSSSSDRSLVATFSTDQERTFARPRPFTMTTRTNKALRPTQAHYIIVTILLCCKPRNELLKIFRVILVLHNVPSISKYMAGILQVVVTGGKRIPSQRNSTSIS